MDNTRSAPEASAAVGGTPQKAIDSAYQILTAIVVVVLIVIAIVLLAKGYRATHRPAGAGCVVGGQCRSGVCLGGGALNIAPAMCA